MMAGDACVYHSAPGVVWLRDAGQTIVADRSRRSVWRLDTAQTILWDLMVLDRSFEHIAHVLSLVLDISEEEADRSVVSMLEQWVAAGIVQRKGDVAWLT